MGKLTLIPQNRLNSKHYLCGNDNKWTTSCVAAYCDDGYKFDYENQKCILDVCFPPEIPSESSTQPIDPIEPVEPSEAPVEPVDPIEPSTNVESSEETTEMEMWIIGGCCIGAVILVIVFLGLGLGLMFRNQKKNRSGYSILE